MKEVTFIRQNIDKWKDTEKVVEQAKRLSPDQLADVYSDLTADLAFAQTHFPNSRITILLLRCITRSIGISVRNGRGLSLFGLVRFHKQCMMLVVNY